jgi:hypothetical protein
MSRRRRTLGLWTVLSVAIAASACGSSRSPPGSGPQDGPVAIDTSTFDLGRETIGSDNANLCCAPGEGTACCAGMPLGNCFKYGGIYGDCRPHGALFEAKITCAHCCGGLTRVSPDVLENGECRSTAPPSLFICLNCGDGICSPDENPCRCPADCPRS